MCGFCGFLSLQDIPDGAAVVSRMQSTLDHRGPDGTGAMQVGCSSEGELGGHLGHRRLKVIDTSEAADQPMATQDGSVILVYNGEVYNFLELRRELRARGHRFRSHGDTEVVLRAYEEWGADCVERLDGMFALAIWDERQGRLLLARDRVGKKPLFYSLQEGGLTFASEMKALLRTPWITAEPDWHRIAEFLTFGYVPYPHSLLTGVRSVPPASLLLFDAEGVGGPHAYWEPPAPSGLGRVTSEDLNGIAELFRKAVARRLVADVPLGALLSGGIDSSLVVGVMSELVEEPLRTFSIGFPEDASFDERRHARRVAEHFRTQHTELEVRMDAVELIDKLIWHHDGPFGDSSAIPTYLVCKLAREHVSVALNGDGGDELFAGYDRFRAARLSRILPSAAVRAAAQTAKLLPASHAYGSPQRRLERFAERAEAPLLDRYLGWVTLFSPDLLASVLHQPATSETVFGSVNSVFAAAPGSEMDRLLHVNLRTYLPDDLAVKMDRMSMANSLETRSPFLDTALLEAAFRLPAARKVGLVRLKPVLRRALWDLLPREIWNRRKHGFGVPLGRWFLGDLGTMYEDHVLADDARTAAFLDRDALARMLREHRTGAAQHGYRLWAVLTLENWLRMLDSTRAEETRAAVR